MSQNKPDEPISVEASRPFMKPKVIYTDSFNFLYLFSVLITSIDCDPYLDECDLAKNYKTYIKIKFIVFVMDTHIKSKYRPRYNSYNECIWCTTIRLSVKNFFNRLQMRFKRNKYGSKPKD